MEGLVGRPDASDDGSRVLQSPQTLRKELAGTAELSGLARTQACQGQAAEHFLVFLFETQRLGEILGRLFPALHLGAGPAAASVELP